MSVNPQENQVQDLEKKKAQEEEGQLVKQRKHYERQIEQERQARMAAEEKINQLAQERLKRSNEIEEDEDVSDEPYVDHKRLKRELGKVVKQTVNETDTRIQNAVQKALAEERKSQWLRSNPDFEEIMQHAQTFADKDPELAETILAMPESFDRMKLVYKNIKALGIHKKDEPKPTIQDKIEQNRRTPFYHPSGVAAAPYANAGDFSPSGQKNSYQKMQELKNRLRI